MNAGASIGFTTEVPSETVTTGFGHDAVLSVADITGVPAHKRVRQGMAYVQEGKRVFHKQTVEQMLKAASTEVKGFTLFIVGEGIEKKVDDFAAEVAAQVAAAKGAA